MRIKVASLAISERHAIYAAVRRGILQSDTCGDNICVDAKELKAWKHRGYRKRQDVNPRRVNQYRGVYLGRGDIAPYFAACKGEFLGNYETPEDAALAYDERVLEVFGKQAITNFPPDVVREQKRIHKGGARRDNITGIRGVNWHSKRQQYRARIGYKGVSHHLGWFDNPIDAAIAYNEKAIELYGDKAKLNKL